MNPRLSLLIIIRQISMISILASQLQFYQKKMYKLEVQVITLEDELLHLRSGNKDQYKIKYELLLQKIAEEAQLKESKRSLEIIEEEKSLSEVNQKWEGVLNEKTNEFKAQLEGLTLEKSSLRNRVVELEMKIIKLQKNIDQGDSQVLKIKIDAIKKENDRLRKENDQLYINRENAVEDMKKEVQNKIQATKQREKKFYRDQIEQLQKKIAETETVLSSQREKINPEREKLILTLQEEIASLKATHDGEVARFTQLFEKRNRQFTTYRDQAQKRQKSSYESISDLTNQVKDLQQRLFRSNFDKDMEIKNFQMQMSDKRQKEADDLKKELERINQEFEREREEWKKIIEQAQDAGSLLKRDVEAEKQRFIEEKTKLKNKIAELKIRLKEKEEDRGNGETEILIKSLREMNNKEEHFSSYQNAITFMDRQIRKATIKLEEKNRQINNLLEELKTLQTQTDLEITQAKEKFKTEQKKLYDRIFSLEEQVDELQCKLREKEKYIKKKEADLADEIDGHKEDVENLKKIIEEMERDYKRLTGNKKSVEDSYREERENVISGKLDINQQKKKKWGELMRQRNELQIVYREREMQIRGDFQTQVDKLKREKQRYIEEKEEYRAEVELLRERLNDSSDDNKENKAVQYQKKLATLDLEIALTQNLFNTLSSATSKQGVGQHLRSELQEMSEGESSKIGSSQSFQIRVNGAITPAFTSAEYPSNKNKEDAFKTATYSFTPYKK